MLNRRSTKAGAETPATRPIREWGRVPCGPLNEGRGRDPGDTGLTDRVAFLRDERSTKAGAETPATQPWPLTFSCAGKPLNEGRGRDPGDTRPFWDWCAGISGAQRRPGPRPRRHSGVSLVGRPVLARSTKAGAETPATRVILIRVLLKGICAQRRPGPRPRRHRHLYPVTAPAALRSTKAGAETPATLLIGAEHLDGRNPAPVLPTDVVTDPQMPSKPATSHNFGPGGA